MEISFYELARYNWKKRVLKFSELIAFRLIIKIMPR